MLCLFTGACMKIKIAWELPSRSWLPDRRFGFSFPIPSMLFPGQIVIMFLEEWKSRRWLERQYMHLVSTLYNCLLASKCQSEGWLVFSSSVRTYRYSWARTAQRIYDLSSNIFIITNLHPGGERTEWKSCISSFFPSNLSLTPSTGWILRSGRSEGHLVQTAQRSQLSGPCRGRGMREGEWVLGKVNKSLPWQGICSRTCSDLVLTSSLIVQ